MNARDSGHHVGRAAGAGRHRGADVGRRPARMLFVLVAETGDPMGWGPPETRGPTGDPTRAPSEFLSGFQKMAAGPSGPPPGQPSRKPPGNDTDFISRGGRLRTTGPTRGPDPRLSSRSRGREKDLCFPKGGPAAPYRRRLTKTPVSAPCAPPRVSLRGVGQAGADFYPSREDHVRGTTHARRGFPQGFFSPRRAVAARLPRPAGR